jgi:psp operon transcriptional activator
VYRHEDPERPIDEISFDPFYSPWAPASEDGATALSRAPSQASDDASPLHLVASAPQPAAATNDFRGAVAAYERQLLEEALRRNRFNQRATAAALGLSYDQLRHALKRHKLQDTAA